MRQVNETDRIVIRNPRPGVEGSVLMIDPTHGGRIDGRGHASDFRSLPPDKLASAGHRSARAAS